MKKSNVEIMVGLFVCLGLICMVYLSIHLGKVEIFGVNDYSVQAFFTSASGLKEDSNVEIAGVRVGKVEKIELEDFQAVVTLSLKEDVKIQDDAIASIKTNGILGEKYIEITPGGSENTLKAGEAIFDTEPPFDLLSVIKNIVIEK